MTDRTFKLDRLAMHQEWYDKNRTMLFIEASVVMQELLAMCRQYKAERDEARRMVCGLDADIMEDQVEYAKHRGWDCFKEGA
jgi:hypothetical protein